MSLGDCTHSATAFRQIIKLHPKPLSVLQVWILCTADIF